MATDNPERILVEILPDGTQVERPMTETEIEELPQLLEDTPE